MSGVDLPVVQKAYDLAREMTARTRKLPRDLKFVLGDRMLASTYDVLDLVLSAKYSSEKVAKVALLDRANLCLERLRFQTRLCLDEHLITARQYEYIGGMILEVGSMVGGWRKHVIGRG